VTFGIVLIVVGGFLLGGAYSVWSGGGDPDAKDRGGVQVAIAGILLLAAVIATAAGILRLV
jgi:hypothetical protein